MGYLDNSGLYIKIGPEVAVPQVGGEYKTYAELREIELTLNLTATSVIITPVIMSDTIFFPKNVQVQEVELYTSTLVAGATGTLNVGLVGTDRTTVIDAAAFLSAFPLGSSAQGTKTLVVKGSAGAGTYITAGTVSPTIGYITADWDTAAFTAGTIKIRIRYLRA